MSPHPVELVHEPQLAFDLLLEGGCVEPAVDEAVRAVVGVPGTVPPGSQQVVGGHGHAAALTQTLTFHD